MKFLRIALGILLSVLFAMGCSQGNDLDNPVKAPVDSITSTIDTQSRNFQGTYLNQTVSSDPTRNNLLPASQSTIATSGIWVSGQSSIALEPDLAILNLGVEASGETVSGPRIDAATAVDAIFDFLKSRNIDAVDIKTQSFNISPQYQWTEVTEKGIRVSKQVLVGYMVKNNFNIKIRDMDDIGIIIDGITAAGGIATRIFGINFTVENREPLMVTLREEAVLDAISKANQFATHAGVNRGQLVFISENTNSTPRDFSFPEAGFARAMSAPEPTSSISTGEFEIAMSVQAVFEIH